MKTRRLYARINETVARYVQEITARTGESTTALLERLIIQEHARITRKRPQG